MKIIISGGSGTGKTETISELCRRGYLTVGETIRQILKQPKYKKFPNGGFNQIYEVQLELTKKQHKREKLFDSWEEPVFFDRSLLDILCFTKYLGVLSKFGKDQKLFDSHDYNKVFILNPLMKYHRDNVRWESENERDALHNKCIETYKKMGYEPIMVPKNTIEKRVNFILSKI